MQALPVLRAHPFWPSATFVTFSHKVQSRERAQRDRSRTSHIASRHTQAHVDVESPTRRKQPGRGVWWVNEKPFLPRVILRKLCWPRKRNGGCAATKMELCPQGSRAVAGTQQGTCWTEGIIAPRRVAGLRNGCVLENQHPPSLARLDSRGQAAQGGQGKTGNLHFCPHVPVKFWQFRFLTAAVQGEAGGPE